MTHSTVETSLGSVSSEQVGQGPDLVILHSLLTDRRAFDPVVADLARSRTVHLVDLPGFGESSPVEGGIDSYADAIGAFLEASRFDPAATALMGNGLGAFIALGVAVRHGHLIERLCLVGGGLTFPEEARTTFGSMATRVDEGGMAAVVEVALRRIFPEAYLARHPQQAEERRRVLLGTDRFAFIAACRALQTVDYRSQASEVTVPTLVVVGSEDGATTPAMAEEIRGSVPRAELRVLDGLGHAPQLQDPEEFVRAISGFLVTEEEQ